MKTKRTISLLLSILMLLAMFTGCGKSDSDDGPSSEPYAGPEHLLPYQLTFGMTYEEFASTLVEEKRSVPILQEAEANDGYLTEHMYLAGQSVELALCDETSDADRSRNASLTFSFNDNKELYEMYWFNSVSSEAEAEKLLNFLIEHYLSQFSFDEQEETDTYFGWKNEDFYASFTYSEENGLAWLTVHSFDHDLDR